MEEYAQIVDYTDRLDGRPLQRTMGQARERIAAGVSYASVAAKVHFDAEARRSRGESTQKRVVTVNSTHSDDDGKSSDRARRQLTGYI